MRSPKMQKCKKISSKSNKIQRTKNQHYIAQEFVLTNTNYLTLFKTVGIWFSTNKSISENLSKSLDFNWSDQDSPQTGQNGPVFEWYLTTKPNA